MPLDDGDAGRHRRQGGRRQDQRKNALHSDRSIRPTRLISQINAAVHRLANTQGDRQKQTSVDHQAVVVNGHIDAVGMVKW